MKAAILLALVSAVSPLRESKEAHSLLPQVKVGDQFVFSYRGETSIGGKEGIYRARYEMAVTSFDPKGTIAFTTAQKDASFESEGQTRTVPDSSVSSRFQLNGVMLSVEPDFGAPERARMSRLMWIVVPEEKAMVGTTWKWSSEPNEANGRTGLKGEGQCEGFETRQGILCAKLRLSAKEVTGENPGIANAEAWISLKDGMPVEVVAELKNVPVAPGITATMRISNRRVAKAT